MRKGAYGRALANLDEAIRIDARLAVAYANRGAVHTFTGDYARALADLDESVRLNARDAVTFHDRGIVHLRKSDYERAIADFNQAIGINARYGGALSARGEAYLRKRDFERALSDLNEAIRLEPKSIVSFSRRAQTFEAKGDRARAIDDYSRALALVAKSQQDRDAQAEARRRFAALQVQPPTLVPPPALVPAGSEKECAEARDAEVAIRACSEAIRRNPRDATAFANRGLAHARKGEEVRAIADYDEAIKLAAHEAAFHYYRANAHLRKGDAERAIADYGEALRLDPRHVFARVGRAAAHTRKRDHDSAIADLNEAVRLDPGNALALFRRGRAFEAKGDRARAAGDYEKLVALAPASRTQQERDAQAEARRRLATLKTSPPAATKAPDATATAAKGPGAKGPAAETPPPGEPESPAIVAKTDPPAAAKKEEPPAAAKKEEPPVVAKKEEPPAAVAKTDPPLGRRVALVIGNAGYKINPLQNPANDAKAVAEALEKRLKFDKVILKLDLAADGFRSALREFSREVTGADLGLVYYAGHGTEVGGKNFLIPVDATLGKAGDLGLEAIPLDMVLDQLTGVTTLKLVILDACRNNFFPLSGAQRGGGRGLYRVEPDRNTLVVFAAKDGTTADDGVGRRHSPFTQALLKHIATPGLELRYLLGEVRDDVLAATAHIQEPHIYGTLGRTKIFLHR